MHGVLPPPASSFLVGPVATLAGAGNPHRLAVFGDRAAGDFHALFCEFLDQIIVAQEPVLSSLSISSCSLIRIVSQATSSPSSLRVPPPKNRFSGNMPRGV